MKPRFSGKTALAVALVIEKGYTQAAAAREVGVDQAAVSRAIKKITTVTICPHCGQEIRSTP